MVMGELPTRPELNKDSEIVALFARPKCPKPPDFPIENTLDRYGILQGEVPFICGINDQENTCFKYKVKDNKWDLENFTINGNRTQASSVQYGDSMWIITGGQKFVSGVPVILDNSEILKDGEFINGPLLPIPLSGHCTVKLHHGFFVAGGYGDLKDSYIFDISDTTWKNLTLMKYGKFGHACGRVLTLFNEDEVIAVGGLRQYETEIFSLKRSIWLDGPRILDQPIFRSATVQGENTFIITGGVELEPDCTTPNCRSNTIIEYNNFIVDFLPKEEKLSKGRGSHTAVPLPVNAVCSSKIHTSIFLKKMLYMFIFSLLC